MVLGDTSQSLSIGHTYPPISCMQIPFFNCSSILSSSRKQSSTGITFSPASSFRFPRCTAPRPLAAVPPSGALGSDFLGTHSSFPVPRPASDPPLDLLPRPAWGAGGKWKWRSELDPYPPAPDALRGYENPFSDLCGGTLSFLPLWTSNPLPPTFLTF